MRIPGKDAMAAHEARRPVVVSREPIHEQILPHIRRDIVEGRWAPGERLPEPLLCKDFGVSRTPLRDALKILESEGLVELVPHVGAVVTDPGVPDVAEKMEVLAAMEQLAAERVAATRPPAALAAIRRLHAGMKKAAAAQDAATYYRLNDEFHRTIVVGSGNKTLMEMHERIMWHVHRARHRANEYERLSEDASEHHDRIVRHLLAGDAVAVARAIREHLLDVSDTILGRHKSPLPPAGEG
jgi:DNA-binding GntR family transcriptional regulator